MAGTLTVNGMSAGLLTGEKVIGPITTTGLNTVGEILPVVLASGDNTFSIPTGAAAVLIVFASGTTATVKVRTNLDAGDAGLAISPAVGSLPWFKKDLLSGEASIILNSSATATGELSFI